MKILLSILALGLSGYASAYTPHSTQIAIEKMRYDYTSQVRKERRSFLPKNEYRIVNYNLGLMRFFVLWSEVTVPAYPQRAQLLKQTLGDFLSTTKPDFLTLQELWHESEGQIVEELAQEHDYVLATDYLKGFPREKHGLEILVKRSIIRNLKSIEVKAQAFERKAYFEKFKFKGLLSFTFNDKKRRTITVGNTHLTPVHGDTNIHRTYQVGDLVRWLNESKAGTFILAGDMNFARTWQERAPITREEEKHWYRNAYNYEALLVMGKLWDLGALYYNDRPTFSMVENSVADYKYGTSNEPDQVLDYIFVRNQSGSVKLKSFSRVFDKPIQNGDSTNVAMEIYGLNTNLPLFLSDHFGVMATIEIQRL